MKETFYFRLEEMALWEGGEMRINLIRYRLVRKTPKGAWIHRICSYGGASGKDRFVLDGPGKRHAHVSIEEAKDSFIARKRRQIALLETNLTFAKAAMKFATSEEFAPDKTFHDETLDPFHTY